MKLTGSSCLVCLVYLFAAGPLSALEMGIDSGTIAGEMVSDTIAVWRGVPYAEPPVGELRFKPPVAVEPWKGVRDAKHWGAPCWQATTELTSIYSRGEMDVSEDCLYLNIWAPVTAPAPRAVMVWYHGGSNMIGHGSSPNFDGQALAERGVIVVTVNYRLGAFGFLTHPALTAESANHSSGNYGLLDQIAALQWVHDNIAAFGGDPNRVTIFGQSAGAIDVCLLMVSPLAKGLFSGAIGQSGGCRLMYGGLAGPQGVNLDAAHATGKAIADKLALDGNRQTILAGLRNASAAELAAAAGQVGPVIDGWVIPDVPESLMESGEFNRVPLLLGYLADELRGFTPQVVNIPRTIYRDQLNESFAGHAPQVAALYADMASTSPYFAASRIQTDQVFGLAARSWARSAHKGGSDVWHYYMTHVPPVFRLYISEDPVFDVPGGLRGLGAYHSGELAYVFGTLTMVGHGWQTDDRKISDLMMAYWVNFAQQGTPNGPHVPRWFSYRPDDDNVLEISVTPVNRQHPSSLKLDLFESIR